MAEMTPEIEKAVHAILVRRKERPEWLILTEGELVRREVILALETLIEPSDGEVEAAVSAVMQWEQMPEIGNFLFTEAEQTQRANYARRSIRIALRAAALARLGRAE